LVRIGFVAHRLSGSIYVCESDYGEMRPTPEQPTDSTINAFRTKKASIRKRPKAARAPSFLIPLTTLAPPKMLQMKFAIARRKSHDPKSFVWAQMSPNKLGRNATNNHSIPLETPEFGGGLSSLIIYFVWQSAKPE
jgi:hypothetical protein